MLRQIACACALAVGLGFSPAVAQSADGVVLHAVDAGVPWAPVVVPGPNGPHIVYELHLTNFTSDPLTLTRVEATDPGRGSTLETLEGDALASALGSAGVLAEGADRRVIASGARAILYMRIPTNGVYEPPSIAHRVSYERTRDGVVQNLLIGAPEVAVDARALQTLGPPLRGGPWVAVYHPDWERGHRRVFYAVDGVARLPGRFAIDWMRAGGADEHGEEVLAVADGVVVAMRDDFPDEGEGPPATLANATGNYVALRIADGRYAFYEHLAQDVRVDVGQRVRRGQVIGTVGASGQVTQPHLHFHLADANAPLAAEGLPYALRYTPLGVYDTMDAFGAGGAWREDGGTITPSFPAPLMVVEFPD